MRKGPEILALSAFLSSCYADPSRVQTAEHCSEIAGGPVCRDVTLQQYRDHFVITRYDKGPERVDRPFVDRITLSRDCIITTVLVSGTPETGNFEVEPLPKHEKLIHDLSADPQNMLYNVCAKE